MTQPAEPAVTTTPPPAVAQNTDPPAQSTQEPTIPKSRFDEINTRAKAAEAELERIKSEQAAATEAEAKKRGEWEKLANDHTATISDLKPRLKTAEETRDRYGAALEAHVKVLRKDVPEHIGALLDRLDPVDQLEWITKNQDQLGEPVSSLRGSGPSPRPTGPATHETRVQENQRKLQSTGAYNPF